MLNSNSTISANLTISLDYTPQLVGNKNDGRIENGISTSIADYGC